jgi:ribosomal protein L37AE/L43A
LLIIILTTIKLHKIFYAYTSLLDKYCEKEKQKILKRIWHCRTFSYSAAGGHLIPETVFSSSDIKS